MWLIDESPYTLVVSNGSIEEMKSNKIQWNLVYLLMRYIYDTDDGVYVVIEYADKFPFQCALRENHLIPVAVYINDGALLPEGVDDI